MYMLIRKDVLTTVRVLKYITIKGHVLYNCIESGRGVSPVSKQFYIRKKQQHNERYMRL